MFDAIQSIADPVDRSIAADLVRLLLDGEHAESREDATRRRRMWDVLRNSELATMERRPEDPRGVWRYRASEKLLRIVRGDEPMAKR